VNDFNSYDLLRHRKMLLTRKALELLMKKTGKELKEPFIYETTT
jgi:hypothetical protein